jgi:hypothetical protein
MADARRQAVGLSVLAALGSLLVGTELFHSLTMNHDEGVYLQQAAMLLDGQLFLHPPVDGPFRPWFFVEGARGLYPKYAPVPAALFAAGKLLGSYRFGPATAAAVVVAGTYGVTREVFADRPDRGRLGVYAAGFVLTSPLFLIQIGTFLPYAPTAALDVTFAYGYLRANRTGSLRWAALAGAAVGLAFFARPYTAMLFALPFVTHALWTLRTRERDVVVQQAVVAVLGGAGVGVALGYNAVVTGDPFTFPYAAFAPADGLGFGHHEILGYARQYTPALALRANAEVVAQLFGRWVAAGLLGTTLAALGLWVALEGTRGEARTRRVLLAGLFLSIVAGNVYFWGNLNVLGVLTDPADGLVNYYGPFYHFDLLVPTGLFAAVGARAAWARVRETVQARIRPDRPYPAVLAALVLSTTLLAAAGGLAVAAPVTENADVTEQLDAAYAPFDGRSLDGAVVFLPTPYGDWLNHPFQRLRNDPGYDGATVYALDDRPFAVVDAYPDRRYVRYGFRGPWTPSAGDPVTARLQRVEQVRGDAVAVDADFGVPADVRDVTIRVSADGGSGLYVVERPTDGSVHLTVVVENGTARLRGDVTPVGEDTVAVGDRDTIVVNAFVDAPTNRLDYRVETPVATTDDGYRALTPRVEVCHRPVLCGGQATYVPGGQGPDVWLNATVREEAVTASGAKEVTDGTDPT